jgi:hypothetical protein
LTGDYDVQIGRFLIDRQLVRHGYLLPDDWFDAASASRQLPCHSGNVQYEHTFIRVELD